MGDAVTAYNLTSKQQTIPPLPKPDGYDRRVEGHYSATSMLEFAAIAAINARRESRDEIETLKKQLSAALQDKEDARLQAKINAETIREMQAGLPPEAGLYNVGDQVRLKGGFDQRTVIRRFISYLVTANNPRGEVELRHDNIELVERVESTKEVRLSASEERSFTKAFENSPRRVPGEKPAVPPGHFWRGDINRHYCKNCGNHWDDHLHTDEASTCPVEKEVMRCTCKWDGDKIVEHDPACQFRAAPETNEPLVPKGHFWRGPEDRDRCENCGRSYFAHRRDDDGNWCPVSEAI